jgi:hypothetical protein
MNTTATGENEMAAEISTERFGFDRLNKMREALEELGSQPAIAYSIDGRSFQFECPLRLAVRTGSYVEIKCKEGATYFGQIMEQHIIERDGPEYGMDTQAEGVSFFVMKSSTQAQLKDRITLRLVKGEGLLLGEIKTNKFIPSTRLLTFQNADLSGASSAAVDGYFVQSRPKGAINIGSPIHGTKSRAYLNSGGFDRHTFLTGQSRSGKSFAMGVILEQLLINTRLPLMIIDPNSDFVKLHKFRKLADLNKVRPAGEKVSGTDYGSLRDRYNKLAKNICVLGTSDSDGEHVPLKIRFSDLTASEKPAVLKLDPLESRDEFHSLETLLEGLPNPEYSVEDVSAAASRYLFEESRNIGLRIANLGIRKWAVWAKNGQRSVLQFLNQRQRCTVIDIGALASEDEKLMMSMVVLGHCWEQRAKREPILIVIDEAHNVAPASPTNELQRICTDIAVRIAGEGLKYGIYLLIATQRPDKLNQNVMSQCDNQIIMRMTSRTDLGTVATTFSQIPSSLVHECANFEQGNALISGRIVQAPTFVQFDGRLSYEGGGDVSAAWL